MAAFWLVLLLLCFPALTGHVAATPVVDVQLEALMAFKDSITDDPLGALAGWTTSPSAYRCAWVGVSCVRPFDNHILSIDLSGRDLTGTISPFLGNISTLELLVLRGNSLHGALPPQLGNLKKLRHLDLGGNSLGGTIPSSICNISTLERLVLGGNSLHGALPPQLGNLKKLQYLDLGRNSIGGTIPISICNISTLVHLVLRGNSLHGALPPQLGNLKKLQYLYLGGNYLGGTIPSSICNISTLERLDLSLNSLRGALPPQLGNLKKLRHLDLGGNSLGGTIPSSICSSTSSLYYLRLSANNFTGQIPPEIKDLVNLLYLDVSANMLSGKLPVGLFFKLRSLLRSDLSRNKLTGELAMKEEGLVPQQLTYLDLSLNAFDGPIPEILKSFNGLVYLNLSFNKFQGPVPEGGVFEHLEPSSLQGNLGLCGAKIHTPCKSNRFSKNAQLVAALSSSLGLLLLLVTTAAIITKRYRRTNRMDHLETTDQILRVHCLKRFTEEDLEFATNFFSEMHVIGKSNLSTVYSGRLLEDGGKRVAVKKLNLHQFPSEYSSKCLLMELKTLGVLKHRNLVKVVGYAREPPRLKALVLELMENGSLEDVIHGGAVVMFDNRSRWKDVSERLRVCISIAGGLVYLHTGYDFPIVHCDLKPSNILFDQEWEAHVSDFGATRMLNIHHSSSGGGGSNMSTTSSFAFQFGTVGYMAPEIAYMTKVTTKLDVFSFGVVIMEFLTGTRPTEVEGQVDGHPLSLPEFVAEAVAGGADGVLPVLDRELELTSSRDVQVAVKLLQLGVTCTKAQVGARPDMPDVLSSLLKLTKEYH